MSTKKILKTLNLGSLSKLNWQSWFMIITILGAVAVASYYGANIAVDLSIETRIYQLEQMLEQELNSSFYGLQKGYSYVISQVGSYYCMQNGTTGKLQAYDTNKTKIEEWALGNITFGTIYLFEVQHNTTISLAANETVYESYHGSLKYYTSKGNGKIGDCPIPISDTYNHADSTTEQKMLEINTTSVIWLYNVYFDFRNLTQDATMKVYSQINGSYVEMPLMRLTIGTNERYGISMKTVMINTDWKFTLTSSIAEGASRIITYRYFKEEY